MHSSSDVREAVSGTIYFLWHSGRQAAHGQGDADNSADKKGNEKENGLKVVLRQCKLSASTDAKEGSKVVLRQHTNYRLVPTPRKDIVYRASPKYKR